MMRRPIAVIGALAVFLLSSTAAAQVEDPAFHSRTTGPFAVAFWTNFPQDGVPEPGVVYTNSVVATADWVFQFDANRFAFKFLEIDEFSFTFDALGRLVPISATNGRSSGDAVTLTVDRELRWASAEATVELTTCVPRPRPELTPRSIVGCGSLDHPVSAGTAPLSASWTGQGDLIDGGDKGVFASPCLTVWRHSQDKFREASASGLFAGRDLGASEFARVVDVKSRDVFVEHFPPAPVPLCPPPE